jgi:predicted dehydrogenase
MTRLGLRPYQAGDDPPPGRIPVSVGDTVLDLGCGTGNLARALAEAGLRVAGCDISGQMLAHAARDPGGGDHGRCGGWVRLAPGWRRLPFASAAFDVVVAASVLEYVAEPAAVLRECARVLRPGGVVLYTVPDLRHPVRWAEWCARRLAGVTRGLPGNGRGSRWNGYHAYLRASLQRHRARWWLETSRPAGLYPVPCQADAALSPLRLLASRWVVATASGMSACRAAERHGFEKAVSGTAAVLGDPDVSVVVIATPHDVHAGLAAQALSAGRHVWCEKPVALACDELDDVDKAWRDSGRQLTLGFNRRWAPALQVAQRALVEVQAPKLLVYRVAAGRIPDTHWYLDRRQGGRALGEVCHFVDTAQALVGADIEDAAGVLAGDVSQADDGIVVALRFADGPVASIAYGSSPPVSGKERIEVLAGSHQVIIDDFRSVQVDRRVLWKGRRDKGHCAHAAAFRKAVQGGPGMPTEAMLGSKRATIQAADRARAS